jgi:hypothetical protein
VPALRRRLYQLHAAAGAGMTGEVQVSLNAGSVQVRLLVQPGMTHPVRLPALVDGEQRFVEVQVSVVGQACPDPAAHVHALSCLDTNYDQHGDCDGPVRAYVARTDGGGVGDPNIDAGDLVAFCSTHAQINGRHIRKADR